MDGPIRILHLDDNSSDATLVALALEVEQKKLRTQIHCVRTKEEYLAALEQKDFDLILSDYRMPGYDGDQALAAAREKCPEIPFIMVTGELGEELVIETLHRGATDYVLKDRMFRLVPAIERALAEADNYRKRKEAEREISKRQGELWAVIQAMHGGVMVFDAEGDVVLVNDALVTTVGYKDSSDLKRNIVHIARMFEFRDDSGRLIPIEQLPVTRIMRGETIANMELKTRRKDTGREWFFSFSGQPVRDETGKQILTVLVVRDITERKKAEEALQKSEERLRVTFERAPLGLMEVDMNGRFVAVNEAICQMLGYQHDELLALGVRDITAEEDRELSDNMNGQLKESGRDRVAYEKRYKRKDGTPLWVKVTVSALRDQAGRYCGAIGTAEDISLWKRDQVALRESEERFRVMADNIPQLAWMTDEKGWIFWYNQRWFDYTGTTLEEMVGWGWQKVHHPDHVERVTERFRRALIEGESWEDTFPLRSKTGEYRWFLSRAFAVKDEAGKVTRWFGTNTDITEQRQVEDALREAALFPEENPSPAMRISRDGTLLYANPASRDILHELRFRVGEKVPDALLAHVNEALEKKSACTFDFPLRDATYSFLVTPIVERQYANLYGRNATEQRQVEKRLRESEELFRLALSAGQTGAWSWNLETDTLKWSEEYYQIFGMRPGSVEPSAEAGLSRVHPDDRRMVEEAIDNARRVGEPLDIIHRLVWPDGSIRWVRCMAKVFFEDPTDPKPSRLVGLAIDVTAQKEGEERLGRLNADLQRRNLELDAERLKWQKLIEGIADEVWACDLEGRVSLLSLTSPTGFVRVNEEILKSLLDEFEVLGSDGFPRPDEESPLQRSLKGKVVRGEEQVRMRSTGEIRIRQHSSVPVRDTDGRIVGAVAIVRDVTEARQAEMEIRRLNEELEERVKQRTTALERANRELEAFSYTVSHDLKAPLRAITGFTGMLAASSQEGGSALTLEKQQQYLELILSSTEQMTKLIESLLSFARAQRQVPQMVRVNMLQLAEQVVQEQRQMIGEAAGRVQVHMREMPPEAQGDPVLLKQVYANLISNAFKFTRKQEQPWIEIGGYERDGQLIYFVRDNGAGFPSEKVHELFQVFKRLHGPADFEGSGIGLANVRKIVERHGGEVCAEGEEGHGATFYFTLPVLP